MGKIAMVSFVLCLSGLGILIFGLSRASEWIDRRRTVRPPFSPERLIAAAIAAGGPNESATTIALWAALISLFSLFTSLGNLWFSQLRTTSRLSAFVTQVKPSVENIKQVQDGISFNLHVDISMQLINNGNTPLSLNRVFLMVPDSFDNKKCEGGSTDYRDYLDTPTFIDGGSSFFSFSIDPMVVAPSSIVVADGYTYQEQHYPAFRQKEDFGKGKRACLVFFVMDARRNSHVKAVPVLNYGIIENGFASAAENTVIKEIRRPVDLVRETFWFGI